MKVTKKNPNIIEEARIVDEAMTVKENGVTNRILDTKQRIRTMVAHAIDESFAIIVRATETELKIKNVPTMADGRTEGTESAAIDIAKIAESERTNIKENVGTETITEIVDTKLMAHATRQRTPDMTVPYVAEATEIEIMGKVVVTNVRIDDSVVGRKSDPIEKENQVITHIVYDRCMQVTFVFIYILINFQMNDIEEMIKDIPNMKAVILVNVPEAIHKRIGAVSVEL